MAGIGLLGGLTLLPLVGVEDSREVLDVSPGSRSPEPGLSRRSPVHSPANHTLAQHARNLSRLSIDLVNHNVALMLMLLLVSCHQRWKLARRMS